MQIKHSGYNWINGGFQDIIIIIIIINGLSLD